MGKKALMEINENIERWHLLRTLARREGNEKLKPHIDADAFKTGLRIKPRIKRKLSIADRKERNCGKQEQR